MKTLFRSSILIVLLLLAVLFVFKVSTYTVAPNENVIITQFGKPIGQPVTTAGLHFKVPFIQHINLLDVRIHEWDGQAVSMPTRDKLYVIVDSFGRWKISDPLLWFTRLRDERSALSRMDDIIGSETRNAVANNDLIEIIRTDKNRKSVIDQAMKVSEAEGTTNTPLPQISIGRAAIEQQITDAATAKLKEFGIDLIDVRFMRINYSPAVTDQINRRMISERKQIANRYRSEGEGEAAKILGNKERDLQEIKSEAYKTVQQIKGRADAKATGIYAQAYNKNEQTAAFYGFLKTLETYRKIATNDTTVVFTTDSDLFHYLKTIEPPAQNP